MKIDDGVGIPLNVIALCTENQSAFALVRELPGGGEGELLIVFGKWSATRRYSGNLGNEVTNIWSAGLKIEAQTR
jgi:hypothetical protein